MVKVLGEPCEDVGPGGIGDVLCFGAVAVGTTIEAKVEICNPSTVRGHGWEVVPMGLPASPGGGGPGSSIPGQVPCQGYLPAPFALAGW